MIRKIDRILQLPPVLHLGAAAAAIAVFTFTKSLLDQSYAASGHPVDYATGQLAFSAEKISGYYQSMSDGGTLPVYWRTQFIDFGFIAAVAVMGLLVPVFAFLGASLDAIENLLSFWMLTAFPAIPKPAALLYSSAAAGKFLFLTCAMIGFTAVVGLAFVRFAWIGLQRLRH
jgi:hypothetical protein